MTLEPKIATGTRVGGKEHIQCVRKPTGQASNPGTSLDLGPCPAHGPGATSLPSPHMALENFLPGPQLSHL